MPPPRRSGPGRTPDAPSRGLAGRAPPPASRPSIGASRTPLRWWPVAQSRPGSAALGPSTGALSGVPGRRPASSSSTSSSSTPGTSSLGVAQQLVERERGDARVEAALLDRRTEDVAPVAARDDVAALVADHAPQQRRARIVLRVAQAQDLALHRAHRHARVRRHAVERVRPGPGGDHDLRGAHLLAALEREPAHAPVTGQQAGDGRVRAQRHAGALGRDRERRGDQARVDGVVTRNLERGAQRRARAPARARGPARAAAHGRRGRAAGAARARGSSPSASSRSRARTSVPLSR